ncbi:MAG: hypothetical protein ACKO70_14470 [Actinomycetota bacterium]
MSRLLSKIRFPRDLDASSRAGLMLAAVNVGMSYQPNLLTRKSVDQGIITGVSGLAGYSWGVAAHSALSSLGSRVGGKRGQPRSIHEHGRIARHPRVHDDHRLER